MQLYSQLDKHVSWLAASAINDDRRCRSGREQEIEDGLAASKALNEFRLRRPRLPRHLMSLVLPVVSDFDIAHAAITFHVVHVCATSRFFQVSTPASNCCH